jgi:hypothetical protein
MQDYLAKIIVDLDWNTFEEFTLVGDLADVFGLVVDEVKSDFLCKLALVTATIKSSH